MFTLSKRRKVTEGPRRTETSRGDILRETDSNVAIADVSSLTVTQTPHAVSDRYFMEGVNEGDRLERKTDPFAVGEQLLAAGLRHGMRALDVACGTGAVTRVMAKIAGAGNVIGLDLSKERLDMARRFAERDQVDIEMVLGEAERIPLSDASFDFTHARFLFEYLSHPGEVLAEMIRVTKPGGSVVVADLDGQIDHLYPMDETLRRDVQDAMTTLQQHGFDPLVGRKLHHLFVTIGLKHVQVRVIPYQIYTGGLSERDLYNWQEKLATASSFLARLTGEHERWKDFREAYLAQLTAHDAFYYSTIMMARGVVPV